MAVAQSTPGVYVQEVNAFPNSVVPVATAVPAFIGYTPQAIYEGKSLHNKAQAITSMDQFKEMYCFPNSPAPADPAQQYSPEYYLVQEKDKPTSGDHLQINGNYYSILPDPYTIYYLYNSVQWFFENGGGSAYIVAVGDYGSPSGKPMDAPGVITNPNVALADLQTGLQVLSNETEPTMYICPEATLLNLNDNGTLMEQMLVQAEQMQTCMCIFDVIGGRAPDPINYTKDIMNFREKSGMNGLKYGACYYPFVGTTLMQPSDLNFSNLFGGDVKKLGEIINPPGAPQAIGNILNKIENPPASGGMTNNQYQRALLIASPLYGSIMKHILKDANILPPSGGMAGVYALNDSEKQVWHAPANTNLVGGESVTINLSDSQQADLNVDALTGKSINAIRSFPGFGPLIWGARTLDGNSEDWRYIPVRRTVTMLEQSVKLAARAYVFEANNANTWAGVKSMISSFLTEVWKEGGLQGVNAAAAFNVLVGLGSTMQPQDIQNGVMRISVLVAVTHPAEFIEITFSQKQATAG